MPDCDYCADSFDSEEAYLEHLRSTHEGELSRIDQRRVDDLESDGSNVAAIAGPLVIAAVFLLAGAAVAAIFFQSGAADEPHSHGSAHEHGTMEVVIDGQELPLASDRRYAQADRGFHFHGDEQQSYGANLWHIHAQDVTLQYALGSLGIDVNDDGTELTFDGRTYDAEDPGTEIRIEVDGEPVEPGDYYLEGVGPTEDAAAGEGDDVRVVVETDG